MNVKQVRERIQNKVKQLGSQKAVAKACGVSLQYLNDVIHGRREPGESLLEGLGLKKKVEYMEK
jgi:transcriptional regulator with XRE-family HTH domain